MAVAGRLRPLEQPSAGLIPMSVDCRQIPFCYRFLGYFLECLVHPTLLGLSVFCRGNISVRRPWPALDFPFPVNTQHSHSFEPTMSLRNQIRAWFQQTRGIDAMLGRRWTNNYPTLHQFLALAVVRSILAVKIWPINQWWFNVGPASQRVEQHWTSIGRTSSVWWEQKHNFGLLSDHTIGSMQCLLRWRYYS